MSGARWLWSIGVAVAIKTLLFAGAFLLVAIYAHGIHPGEDAGFYESFAQRTVPFFALILGALLFFAAGRWLATRFQEAAKPTALGAWMIHSLLDIPILLTDGSITGHEAIVSLTGWTLFLIAVSLGLRRGPSNGDE